MSADLIHYRGLTLDVCGYKLLGAGRSEYLTSQQTRLLAILMAQPTSVHSFQSLAAAFQQNGQRSDEALKVSISRIRRSIRLVGCTPQYLLSVRGLGYIFDPTGTRAEEQIKELVSNCNVTSKSSQLPNM